MKSIFLFGAVFFTVLIHANAQETEDKNNLLISFEYGFSNRIAPAVENAPGDDDFYKDLKSGTFLSASLGVFVNNNIAIGGNFNQHSSAAESSNVDSEVTLSFIGPQLFINNTFDNGVAFSAGLGIGYHGYKEIANVMGEDLDLSGGTVGTTTSIGIGASLIKNVHVGAKISTTSGVVRSIESNGRKIQLEPEFYESLFRINGGITLTFIF